MVYGTAPFSVTLNDPKPSFQGQAILWRWISPKWQDGRSYRGHPFMTTTQTGEGGSVRSGGGGVKAIMTSTIKKIDTTSDFFVSSCKWLFHDMDFAIYGMACLTVSSVVYSREYNVY